MRGQLLALSFGVVIALASQTVAGTNLLVNGDFATGDFTGWTVVNVGGSGVYGAGINGSGEGYAYVQSFNEVALSQSVTATAGQTLHVSAYVRTNSDYSTLNIFDNGSEVSSQTIDSQFKTLLSSVVSTGHDVITYDIVTQELPGHFGDNSVVFENAVVAVPEPASWAMMLVGAAGLGSVMRRRRELQTA